MQNPCPGHAQVSDVPSPSEDGDALKINYESGNPAYIGSGAPQWRLWNGSSWQTAGVKDNNINAGKWYTLTIDGNIVNGKVHYLDFIIHGTTHSLTQYTFAPTSETGDGLVAAVQVDGDAHSDPYQLYLDNSHFYWK